LYANSAHKRPVIKLTQMQRKKERTETCRRYKIRKFTSWWWWWWWWWWWYEKSELY
jgi:hypothetical protein